MSNRTWISEAVRIIEADFNRSADTHLLPLSVSALPDLHVYFKDESSHPTGSLKHRLARSLFLYALTNGWLARGKTIVEASSGSTAVSEAYFARLLGLPFVAVMPRSTSPDKIAAIEFYGGRSHFVAQSAEVYAAAAQLARECDGHTWTNSLTRNAQPTGAATTTSPSRCSRRWRTSNSRNRAT